jgi:hypothetical protein
VKKLKLYLNFQNAKIIATMWKTTKK